MESKQPSPNPQSLWDEAVRFHQSGNLAQAELLYRQILAADPGDPNARHRLGILRAQQGQTLEALELIGAVLQANPDAPDAQSDYGNVLKALSRHEEALASYDRALAIRPDFAMALSNRGVVLADMKRFEEALASYDKALGIKPDYAMGWNNRGNALFELKRFDEALASYDRALGIRPDYAMGWNNRGNALFDLKRFDEALASYDKALGVDPDYVDALNGRANALRGLNRFEDALESLNRALAIRPDYFEAWNNRANVLRDMNRPQEALASYDKAIAISPDFADAWNNAGNLLRDMKRLPEAFVCYDRVIAIRPDFAVAHLNRGHAFLDLHRPDEALECYDKALDIEPDFAAALSHRGHLQWAEFRRYEPAVRDLEKLVRVDPDYQYARGDRLHLRMHGADWRDFEREAALIHAGVRAGKRVIMPFAYMAVSESPADLQACARIYADHQHPAMPALRTKPHRRRDKIRVGYVSGEFRAQATAVLTAGLYELHDKDRFEIIAFDNGWNDESPTRKRLESAFDKFVDISQLPDKPAAEKIAAEEIDILVNLNGYFGLQRMGVFVHRPAPVQVNYLGFPGTLGTRTIDYILADRFVIPEEDRRYYDEQVVYLPDTYQVNDSKRDVAQSVPDRAENGLPEKGFVFCSFNQGYKLTQALFAVWMRILKRTEGSVLWQLESNEACEANLKREAERHGVAGDRLVFAPYVSFEKHSARLKLGDLFLDCVPVNAHTTASDALWAGLPFLTCRGNAFPGRVAASLLHAVGLPELVTGDLEAYEALAVKLANDPVLLRSFCEKLSHNRFSTPLFDTDRFRRHIESAYTTMWEISQRGENPRGFSVDPVI